MNQSPAVADLKDRELSIMRTFDAPRQLVWKAWTERDQLMRWSCPTEFTMVFAEGDLYPGGQWRTGMRSLDGEDFVIRGVYREVVAPERLVFTHCWEEDDGSFSPETLISLIFTEQDGKTTMHFKQSGFASVESRNSHNGGWSEAFEKLQAHIEGSPEKGSPAQKITPFLWFDDQADEAANFYTTVFKNSRITKTTRYLEATEAVSGKPAGSIMSVEFQLDGHEFVALNGGPHYSFSPAISFVKNCDTEEETDAVWQQLSEDGMILMKLGTYPFSEKFGWVQDKYGVSWQVNYAPGRQAIAPCLMFTGKQCGKAEEAITLYTSLFENSGILKLARYSENEDGIEGTVKHALFELSGQKFSAIDSNLEHAFTFTPAISLHVSCESQEEVDRLWERFIQGGETEQCGWLRDKYGVSWQIVPTALGELLNDPDPEKAERVVKAMLQMVKLDIRTLQQAYGQ